MNNSAHVIKIYGITKDSNTNNFMMVIEYAKDGNIRQKLNRDFNSLSQKNKLYTLRSIACGLSEIHNKGLTHQDFHSGNILHTGSIYRITDLGLCKPANEEPEKRNKTVYGVLPYVAPEV